MDSAASSLDGYLAEVEYPSHFHRETMPVWLVSVLTALGRRAPDLGRPYAWLELGCGAGLNTLVAAAANPSGHFIGIDFNADAIARARALAQSAGIANAVFHCLSFEAAATSADDLLPPCDFIVTHGVYSWVSPANRQAIHRIVQRRLSPDGVFHVCYMSQPGNASLAAAQRLVLAHARSGSGRSDQRIAAALAFLQQLRAAGTGYFAENPGVAKQIDVMLREDPTYLAHELLTEHWQPQHVADVIAAMAQAGCRYVGSATPLENIDAVSIPAATQPLLASLREPALIETAKDIARNQSQRRDLYQRAEGNQPRTLSAQAHRNALLDQTWAALPAAPAGGGLRFETRIGPVDGPAELFGPLLQALASGPQTLRRLAQLPTYATQPGVLNMACQTLLWAGLAHPLAPAVADAQPQPAWALNRALAADDAASGWLVAPALGTALPVNAAERRAALDWLADPASAAGAGSGGSSADRERLRSRWRQWGVIPPAVAPAGPTPGAH